MLSLESLLQTYTYLELALIAIAVFTFIMFLYLYLGRFLAVAKHKHSKVIVSLDSVDRQPVTIVVVIKDEQEYIEEALPILLTQEYSAPYQVVVVNDTPELESTMQALEDMVEKYPNLYVTTIKRDECFKHTNKLALTIGMKAAKYPFVLVTDTYSVPAGKEWLGYMAYGFVSNNSIVSGYNRVAKGKGLASIMERVVNIYTSLQMLSSAVAGKPYRVSRNNMGQSVALFFGNKGYTKHLRLNSGEFDLFFQRVAQYGRSSVILNPKAVTISQPARSYSNWYNRRKFNTFTYKYYNGAVRFFIESHLIGQFLFWGSVAALIALQVHILWMVAVGLILFRIVVIMAVLSRFAKRVGERVPYFSYILYDIFAPIDAFMLAINRNIFPSKDLWI